MNYDMPSQQRSPTPSNWFDMLNPNSLYFDDNNNNNNNNNSSSVNNNNNINLDSSKIFNADMSMFDLPDINMLMDENIDSKFNLDNGFDNEKLLDELNGSLEPIPQEFFLTKELSTQFLSMKNTSEKEQVSANTATFKNNQKLLNDLKETVYKNDNFQSQVVSNLEPFISPNNKKIGKRLSSDGQYIVNDNTPEGYKFPSETKSKNPGSNSSSASPLRNKNNTNNNNNNNNSNNSINNKYSVLDKYINVSDDENDGEENDDIGNLKFSLQASPLRQPANTANYYNTTGSSPVASTSFIQQESPIRKAGTNKKETLKDSNNNNLSFFDVPQLQFTENNFQNEQPNTNNKQSKLYYHPPPEYSHFNTNYNMPYPPSNYPYLPMGNSQQFNSYDYYMQQQHHHHQQQHLHQNQQGQYENNNYNYNNQNPPPSSSNNTMVSSTSAGSVLPANKNAREQRLKSYNSVGTSQSTILEEPSPYQQQLPTFESGQQVYQRVISNSNSHTSSVQKKNLGLGLNIKVIKEEQELALNDALMNKNTNSNDILLAAQERFDLVNELDGSLKKQPTRKLSKLETPQLQQVPFFSSGQPDFHDSSPTTITNNQSPSTYQYVKIQSPTQDKPIIGMINRSPKGIRKKSTLPPGTIDQYIAELADKTFICLFNDCQRKFPRRYNIRAHVQTHLQDRPHACELCGNSFVRNHDLVRHKKTHLEKKFGCDCCGKMFLTEKLVDQHKASLKCSAMQNKIVHSNNLENEKDTGLSKKKKIKSDIEFGTQVVSKSGRVTKLVSPKKQNQQAQLEKKETALEFKNTMAATNNVNKVVKKDIYHFNTVKF